MLIIGGLSGLGLLLGWTIKWDKDFLEGRDHRTATGVQSTDLLQRRVRDLPTPPQALELLVVGDDEGVIPGGVKIDLDHVRALGYGQLVGR